MIYPSYGNYALPGRAEALAAPLRAFHSQADRRRISAGPALGLVPITRLLTYQAGRSGAFPALLASARFAPAGYPLNGRERLVTTKIDAAAAATFTHDNTHSCINTAASTV
jgi:hypothetical protein